MMADYIYLDTPRSARHALQPLIALHWLAYHLSFDTSAITLPPTARFAATFWRHRRSAPGRHDLILHIQVIDAPLSILIFENGR